MCLNCLTAVLIQFVGMLVYGSLSPWWIKRPSRFDACSCSFLKNQMVTRCFLTVTHTKTFSHQDLWVRLNRFSLNETAVRRLTAVKTLIDHYWFIDHQKQLLQDELQVFKTVVECWRHLSLSLHCQQGQKRKGKEQQDRKRKEKVWKGNRRKEKERTKRFPKLKNKNMLVQFWVEAH